MQPHQSRSHQEPTEFLSLFLSYLSFFSSPFATPFYPLRSVPSPPLPVSFSTERTQTNGLPKNIPSPPPSPLPHPWSRRSSRPNSTKFCPYPPPSGHPSPHTCRYTYCSTIPDLRPEVDLRRSATATLHLRPALVTRSLCSCSSSYSHVPNQIFMVPLWGLKKGTKAQNG